MRKRILNFLAFKVSLLLSWLKIRQFNLTHPDLVFRSNDTDLRVFRQIFQEQVYYHFPDNLNPKIIVDVGANVGYSPVWFASKFPLAKIFALEPFPPSVELLRKNAQPYPNLEVISSAIWHEDAQLSLNDPGKGAWGIETKAKGNEEGLLTNAISMTSFCQKYAIEQIDILKMDVEGAEWEIFSKGSLEWIDRVRLVQIETHESRKPGVQALVDDVFVSRGFQKWTTSELSIFFKS